MKAVRADGGGSFLAPKPNVFYAKAVIFLGAEEFGPWLQCTKGVVMDACFAARLEALKLQACLNRALSENAVKPTVSLNREIQLDAMLAKLRADLRIAALRQHGAGHGRGCSDSAAAI